MKKHQILSEVRAAVKETVSETVKTAVKEAVKEKTDTLRELPAAKQISETVSTFGGLSAETAKLIFRFVQCFSVFITLVYAVRQLAKEIKSPL